MLTAFISKEKNGSIATTLKCVELELTSCEPGFVPGGDSALLL